jgi:signal transduction histidine kinase
VLDAVAEGDLTRRELVRRVDGRIWVESKLGEGSSFLVELPAAARASDLVADSN